MKLGMLGTLLLLFVAVIWWRTASLADQDPATSHNAPMIVSREQTSHDPSHPGQKRSPHRNHTAGKELQNTLDAMGLSLSADRIGGNSAEGSVRLNGPNELEIKTDELTVSHSKGDLIMVGPTQLRLSGNILSVSGERALMRINPDGSFSTAGEVTIQGPIPRNKPRPDPTD